MATNEVDKQRSLLRALQKIIEANPNAPVSLSASHVEALGKTMGWTKAEAVQLFVNLITQGLVITERTPIGDLYVSHDLEFVSATLTGLTERGRSFLDASSANITTERTEGPDKRGRWKHFWTQPAGIWVIAVATVLGTVLATLQSLGIGLSKVGVDPTPIPTHPRVVEMKLDTWKSKSSEQGVAIISPYTLSVGQSALVVVTGTYSTWVGDWWLEPACKGTPEPAPQYKSEFIVRPGMNGAVGLDAEFMFASPARSEYYCQLPQDAPIRSFTPFQFSTDGVAWKTPTSDYNSNHVYRYVIKGQGFAPQFRIADMIDPNDNYGILLIYMELIESTPTPP